MYSKIQTAALVGIGTIPVTVEVDMSPGLPVFDMVGNISNQVREGKERIRTALHNLGILMPAKRITINLSPASVRKDSAAFDVPISICIMCALGMIDKNEANTYLFAGELNLSGELLPVNGILPIVSDGMSRGIKKYIVPAANVREARLVEGAQVFGFSTLSDLFLYFQGNEYIDPPEGEKIAKPKATRPDFCEVNGQLFLRRAAEISAAGMHNLLLIGPPGAGKTMIAERMPSILPPLSQEERLEISKIYSIKGLLQEEEGLLRERPFRSPHHTISRVGMTGGGPALTPGEISLAHTGVLFLDEMTEFDKDTLEILRQPLEDKKINITRFNGSVEYPTDFLLLGAMNPCNCGYYPDMQRCRCTPNMRKRYYDKLSQPLIDRIDLFVRAEPLCFSDLNCNQQNENSKTIRKRVNHCHEIQLKRYEQESFYHNSQIPASKITKYCALEETDLRYMESIFETHKLTGRTYHKILRVARTIADLEGTDAILHHHLVEAVCFRNPDEFTAGEVG